jgi:GT2 family glycosyltransferase
VNKLSIIIVNYNVSYFLEQALLSVRKASEWLAVEVFVIDNNSVDGSVPMVKNRFPEVRLIENKKNVGFSRANNQAIRLATGEYILLLNPDTVLEEDSLLKCCDFMDQHPDAGALGVKMLDGKGHFLPESKRGLPTPEVAFYKIFGLSGLFPKSKTFGRYHLGFLDEDKTHEVEVLAGAFMFLRKSTLDKIGLLDEDYFMYGEDIDLSYRVILGGYKNYYFPETRIIHYKGESTKRTSVNYVFVFYKAMSIFAKKHFSKKRARTFSFLINIAIYIRASVALFYRFWKTIRQPAFDFGVIYGLMWFMTLFWEKNYKEEVGFYPFQFLAYIVPSYIAIWLTSIFFSGGYNKEFRFYKVLRGALWGTIMISSISNFFDEIRFSRALILIGFIISVIAFYLVRLAQHFIKHKNIRLGETRIKRTILVGEKMECERVRQILDQIKAKVNVMGFLQVSKDAPCEDLWCLGNISQLNEAIMIYDAEELIFCSKNIPSFQIIEWMTKVKATGVDFKIVPDDSNYIIGSNSKETIGELYTFDLELAIAKPENMRSKRLLDLLVSSALLTTLPIHFLFVKTPWGLVKNIFFTLIGQKSWVGFSNHPAIKIPKVKPGILTPICNLGYENIDAATIKRLDLLYAREYKTIEDLYIIVRNYRHIGR